EKKDLQEAQRIFAEEREKLNAEKLNIDSLRAEAEKAMSDAKIARAEAEEKIRKADEIIGINEEQKEKIASLTKELERKEAQIRGLLAPSSNGELYAMLFPDAGGNISFTASTNGIMNWSDGSVRAKGLGVAPKTDNEAQGRALARRAAVVDLQRNLLETVQGVQIDSKTTVENYVTTNDRVNSAVNGMIKGVEVIEENWNPQEKTYTVLGQIRPEKMSGAMSEIRKHVPMSKKLPREPKKKTGQYTGLILDVRHLSVEQQKFFHVVDEKGNLVYGSEYADKKIQDQSGLCAYYEKIVLRDNEKEKVGDNPLVVKAQRFAGNGTDIVIPNEDAEKIRSNAVNFRKDCKVIIVRS
ncbi:MAG: LPP20 family lipoprotein, partial [Synergistaceae bacterium]|nr:LPP20 family lipoprotein [Synergistaceae bacterium]